MSNLAGLHDIESTAIAPPDTWVVDTIALSENPTPKVYRADLHVITRLNWGYGSTGTLPVPDLYPSFSQRVAKFVNGSQNCRRWQIANETNLSREFPDGQPIYPWNYAAAYKLCRSAIHALPGHESDEVLLAASGPWNADLKYDGNPNGDWIQYFADCIELIDAECSGFAIHSYCHGYDVSLVTSTARMNPPFQNRYFEFYTYRDYMNAIPSVCRQLPVYITEANGNGPWQAVGLMPAMLQEIDGWNHSGMQPISSVCFYRYPRYDDFFIEGRQDVIAEYQAAVALGYRAPTAGPGPAPGPEPEPEPPEPEPPGTPWVPPSDPGDYLVSWDPRLDQRGCTLIPAPAGASTETVVATAQGETAYRVIMGKWYDEQQAQGRVNVYVTVLDEQGNLLEGIPVRWYWLGDDDVKPTTIKSDPWLGGQYSLDFSMYNVAPSYGVEIADGAASDSIWGCGLGSLEQPDYKIHTAYSFTFQRLPSSITPPIPPDPPTPTGKVVHPVAGAPITQHFGQSLEDYSSYGMYGHDGCDFGVAAGTPVACLADGVVVYSAWDDGYGNYVRVAHDAFSCYSFYAHLLEPGAAVGTVLSAGQTLGKVGSTGNSTGPHLHFEIRLQNVDGSYKAGTPMPSGRVCPETWCILHGLSLAG